MSQLEIKDGVFGYSGKFKGYSQIELEQRVAALGGTVSLSIKGDMTAFLAGSRAAHKKVDKAKSLGLKVISDDLLYELLEKGEVALEGLNPTEPVDDLISEARSVLASELNKSSWEELVKLVDRCPEERAEDLVAYLLPQMDVWSGTAKDPASVRAIPKDWMGEMISGSEHPKYALCDVLSFRGMSYSNAQSVKLLKHPALKHIKTIHMGSYGRTNKKKNFYKTMAKCPHLGAVERLELNAIPDGGVAELLKATSLPSLKAIFLMCAPFDVDTNNGADVMFGPWASQLETIHVNSVPQLRAVADRVAELTSLHTLSIDNSKGNSLDCSQVEQITRLAPHFDTLVLGQDFSLSSDIANILDAIESPVDTVDMSKSFPYTLSEATGQQFAQKHFVDNGLATRLKRVIVSERVDMDVVTFLREHGLEVLTPLDKVKQEAKQEVKQEAKQDSAQTLDVKVAPDEDGLREGNEVRVEDAMMFPYPCKGAWNTLTGVVDALEVQLDADAFEQAVQTLEAYLASWPDTLRVCPERWCAAYMSDTSSPKVRLSRTFNYDESYHYPKEYAAWVTAFAKSEHCKHFTRVHCKVSHSKGFLVKALSALFKSIEPTSYYLSEDSLKRSLDASGLLPASNPKIESKDGERTSDFDTLSQPRVMFAISSLEQFTKLVSHTELDHIISLDLYIHFSGEEEWGHVDVTPASFKGLRHLRLSFSGEIEPSCNQALAEWLGDSRPVYINEDFSDSSPFETPALLFAEKGMYSRTYGSGVHVPPTVEKEQLAFLGSEDFHVASISVMYGQRTCPGTMELVEMMHDGLKQNLNYLKWPWYDESFEGLGNLFSELPKLNVWRPVSGMFEKKAGRKPLFEVLASTPESAQLCQVGPVDMDFGSDKYAIADLKVLKKGVGVKPHNVVPYRL